MNTRRYDKQNNPVYATTDNQIEFSVSAKRSGVSVGSLKRANVTFNFGLSHAEHNQDVINAVVASSTPMTTDSLDIRAHSFRK